jgi:hypothetical protein
MLYGGKDIENRNRATRFRGNILIHASLGWDRTNFPLNRDGTFYLQMKGNCLRLPIPDEMPRQLSSYPRGGIVGVMEIIDCVNQHNSPWYFGKYGYIIKNVRPLPFVACKGALGLWDVPEEVVQQLGAELEPLLPGQ